MSVNDRNAENQRTDRITEAICDLACAVRGLGEQLVNENKAILKRIEQKVDKIMATQAEIEAALAKVDAATNKLASNVQLIADTDQKISDEIDAFLKAAPVGTVITDAQAAQLQAIADRAQATSDASDAQVAVLQAIAAKGAGNPVPVPVPAPPVV